MPVRKLYRYNVEGVGEFPIDMLRYDSAWPETETDSVRIADRTAGARSVRVVGMTPPTIGRWRSFGWQVVGMPVEVKL